MDKKFWQTRLVIGLLFIIIGFAVILDRYTSISFGWIMGLVWPLLIIYLGFQILRRHTQSKLGLFLTILGGVLLLANLIPGISAGALILPSIIIGIGFFIIYSSIKGKSKFKTDKSETDKDKIDTYTSFWASEKKITSKNFKGGEINVVFGAVEIDLREAKISGEGATIDINAIFAGAEILVPKDAHVVIKGDGFAGSFEGKSNLNQNANGPKLTIEGSAIFAGVEIK